MAAPLRSPPIHAAPLRHTARETPSARLRNKNIKTRLHPTLPQVKLTLAAAAAAATTTTVIAAGGGVVDDASGESENKTNDEIKAALYRALEGINRGIFGTTSENKYEIERLVKLLESQNPTPDPTDNLLETVDGNWKLVYSTVTILGAKRTKLGLRDFISLGDFFQIIEVEKRVDIKLEKSSITPDQLMNLFQKNYDVLLAIFNPEGWLEITYVDGSMRIGRDDKGNIFILERFEEGNI